MGRQLSKSRKQESYGKGKVTPVQIAFIVDRYLSDNNFSQSRSTFRNEASDLISKSPAQEAPKTLLSLSEILDDYVQLKEYKLTLDQEKRRTEQEKLRMQTLLRGMQDVMNTYNANAITVPPCLPMISSATAKSDTLVPQISGQPVYNTPVMIPTSRPSNYQLNPSNFCTPTTNKQSAKRRKCSKDVPYAPITTKRYHSHLTTNQIAIKGNSSANISQSSNGVNSLEVPQSLPAQSSVQGSSVAKCLFSQPNVSPPTNLSVSKSPLPASSSQTNKPASPAENSSPATSGNDVTPQQVISTDCIVISSETITVSPVKQLAYYSIERNRCISTSSPFKARHTKRDHVKGRLDFDSMNTVTNSGKPNSDDGSVSGSGSGSGSGSDKEGDIFDLDLPNLDLLAGNFSLSELLVDFNFDGEFSCHSGSPHEPLNANVGA